MKSNRGKIVLCILGAVFCLTVPMAIAYHSEEKENNKTENTINSNKVVEEKTSSFDPPTENIKNKISNKTYTTLGQQVYSVCMSTQTSNKVKQSTNIIFCECKSNIIVNETKKYISSNNIIFEEDIKNFLTDDLAEKVKSLTVMCLMLKLNGQNP